MDGGDIASTVIGILGLLGGTIGFFVAHKARQEAGLAAAGSQIAGERAAKAGEDAARALRESASAARESAEALKRANELAEETLPSKEPHWEVRHIDGLRWVAFNMSPGKGVARAALVEGGGEHPNLIIPDESEPRDVPPGDGLAFLARRAMGLGDPVMRISYERLGERISAERKIY